MLALGQQVVIPASTRHIWLVIATIGLLGGGVIYAVMSVVFMRRGLHGIALTMGCCILAMAGFWLTAYSAQRRPDWRFLTGLVIQLAAYLGLVTVGIIAWRRRARRGKQSNSGMSQQS